MLPLIEAKLRRTNFIYLVYPFIYFVSSIFIIQFLIFDSYGINNNTFTKNIKIVDTIDLDTSPQCIEYNPHNGNMYVASQNGLYVINSSTNEISNIISGNTSIVDHIVNPAFFGCIEYNPHNGNMYVPSQNGIYSINSSNNEIKDVLKNTSVQEIVFNEEEGNLYLITGGFNEHTVADVINGTTHETLGNLSNTYGYFRNSIEYNPGNGYVYLTDAKGPIDFIKYSGNNTIKEKLLNNSFAWSVDDSIFQQFGNIFYNDYNNTLYISVSTNANDGIIIANATDNTLLDIIPLGRTFIDMDFNPKNGFIYGIGSDGLYVINPLDNYKIINKISQNDEYEKNISFNSKNNYMYLTNPANNTISVIS